METTGIIWVIWVLGLGFRVEGLGFRVEDLGFRDNGRDNGNYREYRGYLRFRVQDLGFRENGKEN